MHRLICTILLAIAAWTPASALGQACVKATGDCLDPHGGLGCVSQECCTTVCELDPTCCTDQWDALCVSLANTTCEGLCGAAASGDCRVAHPSAGCSDAACCTSVCAVDAFCCETRWDATCAFMAEVFCQFGEPIDCATEGTGPCGKPHAEPGCEDPECCSTVCALDASCCTVAWDALCVQLRVQFCFGCILECPTGAIPENEACETSVNDPCGRGGTPIAMVPGFGACGTFDGLVESGTYTGDIDVWSVTVVDSDGDGTARVTLRLSSTAAAFAALVPVGCPVSIPGAALHVNANDCVENTASACMAPGEYWVVFSSGTFPQPGTLEPLPCFIESKYILRVDVAQTGCGTPCQPSAGPCFDAHPGSGCSDAACCAATCTIDPFCCADAWDIDCARTAAEACGQPIPANDACAGALPLASGVVTEFSTIRAVMEGDPLPSSCLGSTGPTIGPDVWFTYRPDRSGNVAIDTCGSAFDTRIAVYQGGCDGPSLVTCASGSVLCSSSTNRARVQFAGTCGTTYLIRIGGENSDLGGSGRVLATVSGPVCPDACPADIDRNGTVDGVDLGAMLGNWGSFGSGDLNLDGTVNGEDLGLLLGSWGVCP